MNLIDRIRLLFRKDRESYLCLYHILGFYPHHISYYKKAFIHKSINIDNKDRKSSRLENNERLEFLGDAILGAIVGDIVFQHFEGKREGFLTNARSKVVQRETLNRIAKEIGLNELIKSSASQTGHNSYMGGNAFEALIGAIYLDRGYDYCMRFMQQRILKDYIDLNKVAYKEVNFKSKLIEWSQKNRVEATFDSTETQAEKNSPTFFSRVLIEGIAVGSGKGYSKKESQQNAAKETLGILKRRQQIVEQIFAAKSKRTAMEEEPRTVVDLDLPTAEEKRTEKKTAGRNTGKDKVKADQAPQNDNLSTVIKEEEMDLSYISLKRKELSRDEIIALAEEAAFKEDGNA